jgi:exopolysaccharide biosynthesis protein
MSYILAGDIVLKKIQETLINKLLLYFLLLGFVLKTTRGLCYIYYFSSLRASGTNTRINSKHAYLAYIQVQDVINNIITVSKRSFIIKRDIETSFCNILVAIQDQ